MASGIVRYLLTILLGCALCPAQMLQSISNSVTASVAATPTLVQWTSFSSTQANATGTTVNGCATDKYCGHYPEGAQAGNAWTGAVAYSNTVATLTVTNDKGDTCTVITTATDSTNGAKLAVWRCLNVTAAARDITFAFSAHVSKVAGAAYEFNNVATSSADDGNATGNSASGSSTMATSTNLTPGTSGDLLFHCGVRSQTQGTDSYTAGASFNLTTTDTVEGLVCQWRQYNSTSLINPSLTMASNSGYATAALALKTATAGSARPAGMQIVGIQHVGIIPANMPTSGTTIKMQFKNAGNLVVLSQGFGGTSCTISSITDANNTWTARTQVGTSATGKSNIFYVQNAAAGNTFTLTTTGCTNGTDDGTVLLYDIAGAATSSVLTEDFSLSDNAVPSATTYQLFSVPIAPGSDSGIAIGNFQQNLDTTQSISNVCTTIDVDIFGGENLSGSGTFPPDENNGWFHCKYSNGNQEKYVLGYASNTITAGAYHVAFFKSATANPSALYLDDFTRADINPLNQTVWGGTSSQNYKIVSNKAVPVNLSLDAISVYTGGIAPTADQWAQCTLGTLTGTGSDSGPGVALRFASGANTGYRIIVSAKTTTPNVWLDEGVAGTYTTIATGFKGSAWTSGDIVYAKVATSGGNAIITVRNGVGGSDLIAFTDTTPRANAFTGLAYSSTLTAASCTAFAGGNL